MKTISCTDAVKRWGEVLDLAKGGEVFTLESHGRPVATLRGVPKPASAAELRQQVTSSDRGRLALQLLEDFQGVLEKSGWLVTEPALLAAARSIAEGMFEADPNNWQEALRQENLAKARVPDHVNQAAKERWRAYVAAKKKNPGQEAGA